MPIDDNAELHAPDPPNDGADVITRHVHIDAPAADVWDALTNPESMKRWMSDTDIHVVTDRRVGGSFIVRGNLHGVDFENTGRVLRYEPERVFQYSHLSSISELPDEPASYSVVTFRLEPAGTQVLLTLELRNFPTESIYKHLLFYWSVTLEVLKRMVERWKSERAERPGDRIARS